MKNNTGNLLQGGNLLHGREETAPFAPMEQDKTFSFQKYNFALRAGANWSKKGYFQPHAPTAPMLHPIRENKNQIYIYTPYIGGERIYNRTCTRYAHARKDIMTRFSSEVLKCRAMIPEQNRRRFDIEAADVIRAAGTDEKRIAAIRKYWMEEVRYLIRTPGAWMCPPKMIRDVTETPADLLEREYREGGYHAW